MVNPNEGVRKFCNERRLKLGSLRHVLVTRPDCHAAVAGFPSVVFHLADMGTEACDLVGPPGLRTYWESTRTYCSRQYPHVSVQEVGSAPVGPPAPRTGLDSDTGASAASSSSDSEDSSDSDSSDDTGTNNGSAKDGNADGEALGAGQPAGLASPPPNGVVRCGSSAGLEIWGVPVEGPGVLGGTSLLCVCYIVVVRVGAAPTAVIIADCPTAGSIRGVGEALSCTLAWLAHAVGQARSADCVGDNTGGLCVSRVFHVSSAAVVGDRKAYLDGLGLVGPGCESAVHHFVALQAHKTALDFQARRLLCFNRSSPSLFPLSGALRHASSEARNLPRTADDGADGAAHADNLREVSVYPPVVGTEEPAEQERSVVSRDSWKGLLTVDVAREIRRLDEALGNTIGAPADGESTAGCLCASVAPRAWAQSHQHGTYWPSQMPPGVYPRTPQVLISENVLPATGEANRAAADVLRDKLRKRRRLVTHAAGSSASSAADRGVAPHAGAGLGAGAGSSETRCRAASLQPAATRPRVTLLGTGAAAPSKNRNCTGIYVQLPHPDCPHRGVMVDGGEECFGQLCRLVDCDIGDVLRGLVLVWVSHHHADHFTGLARLLAEHTALRRSVQVWVCAHGVLDSTVT